MTNSLPFNPTRRCRKMIGPGLSSIIADDTKIISGRNATKPSCAPTKSRHLLTKLRYLFGGRSELNGALRCSKESSKLTIDPDGGTSEDRRKRSGTTSLR